MAKVSKTASSRQVDSNAVASLASAINHAKRSAKFFVDGVLSVTDLDIEVDGLGALTFPLKRTTAKKLVQYCARLNAFLADRANEVGWVPAREDARRHLMSMIEYHQCDVNPLRPHLNREALGRASNRVGAGGDHFLDSPLEGLAVQAAGVSFEGR
jgi:hypothetical protein